MKHIRKFDESNENIKLSMEDVKNLKHNLDYRKKNDFMTNYHWDEDTKLYIKHKEDGANWNGKEDVVYGLRIRLCVVPMLKLTQNLIKGTKDGRFRNIR